jgi:hypothetical protein
MSKPRRFLNLSVEPQSLLTEISTATRGFEIAYCRKKVVLVLLPEWRQEELQSDFEESWKHPSLNKAVMRGLTVAYWDRDYIEFRAEDRK